eukprot:5563404-Alexandrium_andersonii.AAC.1
MSASLVGSEMCIRDSSATHESVLEARTSCMMTACAGALTTLSMCMCNDCLLYTSDAADDM